MDVTLPQELLELPPEDRARLAIALWESLKEAGREGPLELTDEQRRELDRRWEEHQRNPASAVAWSEVRRKQRPGTGV